MNNNNKEVGYRLILTSRRGLMQTDTNFTKRFNADWYRLYEEVDMDWYRLHEDNGYRHNDCAKSLDIDWCGLHEDIGYKHTGCAKGFDRDWYWFHEVGYRMTLTSRRGWIETDTDFTKRLDKDWHWLRHDITFVVNCQESNSTIISFQYFIVPRGSVITSVLKAEALLPPVR